MQKLQGMVSSKLYQTDRIQPLIRETLGMWMPIYSKGLQDLWYVCG